MRDFRCGVYIGLVCFSCMWGGCVCVCVCGGGGGGVVEPQPVHIFTVFQLQMHLQQVTMSYRMLSPGSGVLGVGTKQ